MASIRNLPLSSSRAVVMRVPPVAVSICCGPAGVCVRRSARDVVPLLNMLHFLSPRLTIPVGAGWLRDRTHLQFELTSPSADHGIGQRATGVCIIHVGSG